jgi:hypothetical protein
MKTKTKIQVKKIIDNDTKVIVNSGLHHINEIKREIKQCFNRNKCRINVFQMWEEE